MDIKETGTIILTKDIAAMRDFYAEKVGLEVVSDNGHVVVFRNGLSMHPQNERHTKPQDVPNNIDIAFMVADIQEAVKDLADKGVSLSREIIEEGTIWLGMFSDPEGNDLLLIQRK